MGRKKTRTELSPGPWIAVVIVILVAAIAYWWIGSRGPAPAEPLPDPVQEQEPESAAAAGGGDEEVVMAAEAPADTVAAPAETIAVAASEQAGSAEPEPTPLADGDLRLVLAFSGDCWTEISDANRRRLFFGMGRAGRDVELTGPAPFTLLLGNVNNVAVRVNGSPYAIPASAISNQTARLTILQP